MPESDAWENIPPVETAELEEVAEAEDCSSLRPEEEMEVLEDSAEAALPSTAAHALARATAIACRQANMRSASAAMRTISPWQLHAKDMLLTLG